MSVLGDKDYEDFIKNKYLPFYNSLNEKELLEILGDKENE